eukprot:280226_1
MEIILTVFTCYICYYIADNELGVCAVLSIIFFGFVLSKYKSVSFSPNIQHSLYIIWDILCYVSNTLIFIFAGIIFVYNSSNIINFKNILWSFISYILMHVSLFVTLLLLWYPMKKLNSKKN